MPRGRILFADNNPAFIRARAEFLRDRYDVLEAHTFEQADDYLRNEWLHLAILDMRLGNDSDEYDKGGLALARAEAYRTIPKIILTGFPTFEDVREALRPTLNGSVSTVDFLAKGDGHEAMLRAVEHAFANHVRINYNLAVRWQTPCSFAQFAALIEPSLAPEHQIARAAELEDLFRKLFFDRAQLTFGRLFAWGEGRILAEVFAYAPDGAEQQFVVACGQPTIMAQQDARYAGLLPRDSASGIPIQAAAQHTLHFAATPYVLDDPRAIEEATRFSTFYAGRSTDAVLAMVDRLFPATLGSWFRKGQPQHEPRSVRELCQQWLELPDEPTFQQALGQRAVAICAAAAEAGLACAAGQITFELAGEQVVLPVPPADLHDAPAAQRIGRTGITYGAIAPNSILITRDGQPWLLDFSRAGRGLLPRDFVALELAIKLDLIETSDLRARFELERCLLETPAPDAAAIAKQPPEIARALTVIQRIRQLAAAVEGDHEVYLATLYFAAIARVAAFEPTARYPRRQITRFAHSLLLAALLYPSLAGRAAPEQAGAPASVGLQIDENNKEVWVEQKKVTVAPREFELLHYLYRHAGQLCTREEIMRGVYGQAYRQSEESRLNSALSRLRLKLERNTNGRRYLITVRGVGYRLFLSPLHSSAEL